IIPLLTAASKPAIFPAGRGRSYQEAIRHFQTLLGPTVRTSTLLLKSTLTAPRQPDWAAGINLIKEADDSTVRPSPALNRRAVTYSIRMCNWLMRQNSL